MKIVNTGIKYQIYDNSLRTFDSLARRNLLRPLLQAQRLLSGIPPQYAGQRNGLWPA